MQEPLLVITAGFTLISAALGTLGAVLAFYARTKAKKTAKEVKEIHIIVNSRFDAMTDQLTDTRKELIETRNRVKELLKERKHGSA